MIALKTDFVKKGVKYQLMRRTDNVAFYKCHYADPTAKAVWYEVFEIRVADDYVRGGVTIPQHEICPSDEDFGVRNAKSFIANINGFDLANEYFLDLCAQMAKDALSSQGVSEEGLGGDRS